MRQTQLSLCWQIDISACRQNPGQPSDHVFAGIRMQILSPEGYELTRNDMGSDKQRADLQKGSFHWTPRFAALTQSYQLPQRIISTLEERRAFANRRQDYEKLGRRWPTSVLSRVLICKNVGFACNRKPCISCVTKLNLCLILYLHSALLREEGMTQGVP